MAIEPTDAARTLPSQPGNGRALVPIVVMFLVLLFSGSTIGIWGKAAILVIGNLASTAEGYRGRLGKDVSWLRMLWETALWTCFFGALVFSSKLSDWMGFAVGIGVLAWIFVSAVRPVVGPLDTTPPRQP